MRPAALRPLSRLLVSALTAAPLLLLPAAGASMAPAVQAAGSAGPTAPEEPASDREVAVLELGRRATIRFHQGDLDALWARMTPQMQQALGSLEAFRAFREQARAQLGEETEVTGEEVTGDTANADRDLWIYQRFSTVASAPMEIETRWVFDGEDRIAGFFIRPRQGAPAPVPEPAPSPHLGYQTRAPLRLPFDGAWYVFWGGRTREQNYHVVSADQRFAYDFVVLEDGRSHAGDPGELDSYHCWDRPILAPAAGTVAAVVDGLPDQVPGTSDPTRPAGNHVILDLGDGEHALLAHLRQGSVTVEVGDAVVAGQELGRCGNSGNTSEPHLHFHLQDSPVFGEGDGLPAFFHDYLADGVPVERGEPIKGQTVEHRPGVEDPAPEP